MIAGLLFSGWKIGAVAPTGCPMLLLQQQRDATSTRLADVAPKLLDPEIKGLGAVGSPLGLQLRRPGLTSPLVGL